MELTSLQTSQTRTTTNNSSQSSKASESSQQSSPTFIFDEVLDILLEDGFDATLGKLKELKSEGVISSIKVTSDSTTGKTTISGEYDGVEYEFIGVLKGGNNDISDLSDTTNTSTSSSSSKPAASEETKEDNGSIETGVTTGASTDCMGETFTAYDAAWYGSGGPQINLKENLITACTIYPEVMQPFVDAGLVKMNKYGDYEIADQEAVDKFYGNSNSISMDELKELLTGQNFDAEKIKAYIENQEPLDNDKSFIESFPEEGMDVDEFIQLYREYPDILDAFVQADQINIGRWNELYDGGISDFATDGKITKETLESLLTDGHFDTEKILKHKYGSYSYDKYKENLETLKAEVAEKQRANYEAALKYMEYFNSLSYLERRALQEDSSSTYSSVEYYLEQYNAIMDSDANSQKFTNLCNGLQFYTNTSKGNLILEKVKLTNPELLS